MSKSKPSEKSGQASKNQGKAKTRFLITVRKVGEKFKFIKTSQEEAKGKSKPKSASRASSKARGSQNKAGSEHGSTRNRKKDQDAVSGISGGKKGPGSAKNNSEAGKAPGERNDGELDLEMAERNLP